jgi:arylsulfatase A-like enzyme
VRDLDGERELYDVRRDPGELRNLAGMPRYAAVEHRLRARLDAMRHRHAPGERTVHPLRSYVHPGTGD